MRWNGAVAVVTGASRGIGREVVRMASERGARVGLVARTQQDLEAVLDEIGGRGAVATADVADRQQVAGGLCWGCRLPCAGLARRGGRARSRRGRAYALGGFPPFPRAPGLGFPPLVPAPLPQGHGSRFFLSAGAVTAYALDCPAPIVSP